MAEDIAQREEELAREGWTRQFTVEQFRLPEYIELYESLGLEVRIEDVVPEEMGQACSECYLVTCSEYKTIYTRPRQQTTN